MFVLAIVGVARGQDPADRGIGPGEHRHFLCSNPGGHNRVGHPERAQGCGNSGIRDGIGIAIRALMGYDPISVK